MSDRKLPHSLEAERSALGSILIKPAAFHEVASAMAGGDDFFLPAHREIFDAMRSLVGRGQPIDVLMVADELKARGMLGRLEGGEIYLGELANGTPTAENAGHYAQKVAERAALRRLIATCSELQSAAYGECQDVPAFLGEARAQMASLDVGGSDGAVSFADLAQGLSDDLEARAARLKATGSEVLGVPFGVGDLDRALGGALPGDLGIIAGGTSAGKTALAMQMLTILGLDGGAALAINLEMPAVQLAERMVVNVARVNSHLLRVGQLDGLWKTITGATGRLAASRLFLNDTATTMPRICSVARRWRARNPGKAAIVVDFAQLIRGGGDSRSTRAQEVGTYGQDLKALAKELKLPVVLLSQLNRGGVKSDRPGKHDLKESGDLENAADWVIVIHNKAAEPTGNDPVVFYLDKHRNGAKAQIPGWWVGKHYLFCDTEPMKAPPPPERRFIDDDERETT